MLFIHQDDIQPEFLHLRLSVDEIESLELAGLAKANAVPAVPFGYMNSEWLEFQALAQDGDEFWSYGSPQKHWSACRGSAGYVLLREGRVVATLITALS